MFFIIVYKLYLLISRIYIKFFGMYAHKLFLFRRPSIQASICSPCYLNTPCDSQSRGNELGLGASQGRWSISGCVWPSWRLNLHCCIWSLVPFLSGAISLRSFSTATKWLLLPCHTLPSWCFCLGATQSWMESPKTVSQLTFNLWVSGI